MAQGCGGLHYLVFEKTSDIDPITLEIVQNRLTQVGREAGLSMIRAAASLIVVGAKDLGFNITDHMGRIVVYSIMMPRHGITLAFMLHFCLQYCC